MPHTRRITHELAIAARRAARQLHRRLAGERSPVASDREFRATLQPWLESLPPGHLRRHRFLRVGPTAPWLDTGFDLEPGDPVTLLSAGRVHLSRIVDIWMGPSLRLWCQVGVGGRVFRGTRDTLTFTAQCAGRLRLASRFPSEFLDPQGRTQAVDREFQRASGDLSVLAVQWGRDSEVHTLFRDLAKDVRVPGLVLAEAERLDQPVPVPDHWHHDWRIGASEVFGATRTPDGRPAVGCHTHRDVGILQRDAWLPLLPGTRLQWHWRVTELPSDLPEDTLPSHDYLGIAVEFDDGQDIAYLWSAALAVDTAFRCPLPVWRDIETHVVVRRGTGELGRWLSEERDVHADYGRLVGGTARAVVRVWLIGESAVQRGHGRCEYASIRLRNDARTLEVL